MPQVKSFHANCFDVEKTGTLDHVWTPPYDVIDAAQRRELGQYAFNMTHLILPEPGDGLTKYARAAKFLGDWVGAGTLRRDQEASIYLLRQRFKDWSGRSHVRRGFFAVVKLPEAGERNILGHERTFAKPVEDRQFLMEATRADLEPVFMLYSDPAGETATLLAEMDARAPEATATTMDGVLQELWRSAPDALPAGLLDDATLYIADGHHRFQTACMYRDAMRAASGNKELQAWDYIMAGFVALEEPGLQIYATHRLLPPEMGADPDALIAKLREWFVLEAAPGEIMQALNAREGGCTLGMLLHGRGGYLLTLREEMREALLGHDRGPAWRDLDVAVLHRGILERALGMPEGVLLRYEIDEAVVRAQVASGAAGLGFLLRPTRADQIKACAEAGEAMPQKSTYFFPKLVSGAVMYTFQR